MNEIPSSSDLPPDARSSEREQMREVLDRRRESLREWRRQQREEIKETHWQERARLLAEAAEHQASTLALYFKDKVLPGGLRILRDPRLSNVNPLSTSHRFTVYDRHGNDLGSLTCSLDTPPLHLRMKTDTEDRPYTYKGLEATGPRDVERWLRFEIPNLLILNPRLAEAAKQRPSLDFLNGARLFDGRLNVLEHRENGVVFYTLHDPAGRVVGDIMPNLSLQDFDDLRAYWAPYLYNSRLDFDPTPKTLAELTALIEGQPKLLAQVHATDPTPTVAMSEEEVDDPRKNDRSTQ